MMNCLEHSFNPLLSLRKARIIHVDEFQESFQSSSEFKIKLAHKGTAAGMFYFQSSSEFKESLKEDEYLMLHHFQSSSEFKGPMEF